MCSSEKVVCDTWPSINIFETASLFSSALFMQESLHVCTNRVQMVMWSGKITGSNYWQLSDRSIWVENSVLRIPRSVQFRSHSIPKNDTETLTCRDMFLLSHPLPHTHPIPPSLGSQPYAFSISFSVHFKQAPHVPQKTIRGGYSDKTLRIKDLPLPLAFISCTLLLVN